MVTVIANKHVKITGLSGFVGSNLKGYLKNSFHIESFSVRYVPNQKFEIKADVLIHLGGKAHDLKKISQPKDYYEANFELTKQLFDAFLESDATVFIFMSTVKAAADEVDGFLIEDVIPSPRTHYGISKNQAEEYILSKKLSKNKRVYILRPCMIHGPGNKGNLNLLYRLVAKGVPWPLGDFKNKRSYLSIENLCFVVQELLQNVNIESGIYNLADDEPLSTNELIELLSESLKKTKRIIKIPRTLIKKIALIGDIIKLPLNSERLQKLTEDYIVSNTKIKIAINKELPISSQKGLLKTFDSFSN